LVSLLLIGIAAWGIGFGLISSFRVVGVAIAVGIFLFFIALVGLIECIFNYCFQYMIILLLVFIVQFSVSCACLALNKEQQNFTFKRSFVKLLKDKGETLCLIISLCFSFQILGVWLTYRYRNQKDPRANPSAFL
ncbi:hypothetical protein CIB84_007143, partial [Bambusicola thoracicus]